MPPKVKFQVRHQYDEAADEAAAAAAVIPQDNSTSLTQQQYADDVNINVMMKRMGVTDGAIPPAVLDPAYFGDFSSTMDFRDAMDRLHTANERFKELPADLRKRFNNDPAQLMEFVNDPKNDDEAIKLGLLRKPTPEDPPEIVERRRLRQWRADNPQEAAELFPEPQTPPQS